MTREQMIDEAVRNMGGHLVKWFTNPIDGGPDTYIIRRDWGHIWTGRSSTIADIRADFRRVASGGAVYNTRMVRAAPVRK